MSRIAVFAYGSLVNAASAADTLGRPVEAVVPARLAGWRRRWSTARDNNRSEKTFALADGSVPPWTLGLTIEPDPGAAGPNGALIAVTAAEVERLDLRELRYDRVEVGPSLAGAADFTQVFAWRVKPEHHAPSPPAGAVILRTYLTAVESAFDALGPGELEAFRATTEPPPVELVDAGELIRDEIPPGNPREW